MQLGRLDELVEHGRAQLGHRQDQGQPPLLIGALLRRQPGETAANAARSARIEPSSRGWSVNARTISGSNWSQSNHMGMPIPLQSPAAAAGNSTQRLPMTVVGRRTARQRQGTT